MSQFCFDNQEAATAATGGAPRVRVYKISRESVTKFVIGSNREVALARFSVDVLGVQVHSDRASKTTGGPTQKQIDSLIDKAFSAPPEEAAKILVEVKSLKEQLAEHRAKKKAAKSDQAAASAPAAPPAPPAL